MKLVIGPRVRVVALHAGGDSRGGDFETLSWRR